MTAYGAYPEIDIEQLEFIDKNLRLMVLDFFEENEFRETVITSLYRINDNGVHGQLPLRGIDIRWRLDWSPEGEQIAQWINERWQYDPDRPEKKCCIYHDVGQGAHLHFQTHPNTRRFA